MSLISEQVKGLLAMEFGGYSNNYKLLTIEELSAKLANANMERSEPHYNGLICVAIMYDKHHPDK